MKKAIVSILVFAVILSCSMFGASADTLFGDVNADNQANSSDALLVLQITTGSKTTTEKQRTIADVNEDGKVTSQDALLILQYSVGLFEDSEPYNKLLYYYADGTTGYEPKPGAKCQRSDGSWNVLPEGKIVLEYEDGSLGYIYKPNAVYFDSLSVDPDAEVLFHYEDGTTGYEPKPGARYKANGVWQVVSWGNDLTDEEIKEAHKNDSTAPWY